MSNHCPLCVYHVDKCCLQCEKCDEWIHYSCSKLPAYIIHYPFTKQHNDLHINIGLKENAYRLFSFHGTHIWNHISKTISIDVSMPILRIYQNCIYKLITYLIG